MYLVCGEALFDMFMEPGSGGGETRFDARMGGSPFNVAIGLARLGANAALLTGISRDALGQRLVSALEREGVETRYLIRSGRRTTLSMVGIDETGHPDYVFYGVGSADCGVRPVDLPNLGPEIAGFHFGSYSTVVEPVADALAQVLAMNRDKFVSLDPNVRPTVEPDLDKWRQRTAEFAARSNLIKISREDLDTLYPNLSSERMASDWIGGGADLVIVTDGSKQVSAWSRRGLEVRVEPRKTPVIDTVGAGDSFQAATLAMLIETGHGDPSKAVASLDVSGLVTLLSYGCDAAGMTCGRRGADLPRRNELNGLGKGQAAS